MLDQNLLILKKIPDPAKEAAKPDAKDDTKKIPAKDVAKPDVKCQIKTCRYKKGSS